MSVDPAVYDLAERFLTDVKAATPITEEVKQQLAWEIQQTIEEFIKEFYTSRHERAAKEQAP